MSLEKAIEDQTLAIKDQTAVLALLVAAIKGGAIAPSVAVEKSVPKNKNTAEATDKAPPAETKKAEAPASEPVVEEPKKVASDLPEGTRDAAYYAKHIRPILAELVKQDRPKMLAIIESYGVKLGTDIPVDKWDDLIAKTKEAIAELGI